MRITPYSRTADRGDALYQAWRMVEQSGDGPALFWNVAGWTGDLPAFCAYMTDASRQLFLIHTETDWIGLAWAEDIRPGQHAFLSLFIAPAHRGKTSLVAGRLVTRGVLDAYSLQRLWAMTPWPRAKMLGLSTGAQCVATIPQYAQIDGQGRDVFLLQWMR